MVLDFAGVPPEITSGLMYAGAGAGPLMAAAAAYNNLAAELTSTATQMGVDNFAADHRAVDGCGLGGGGGRGPADRVLADDLGGGARAGGRPGHGVGGRL